jgi:hypothetical protein
MAMPKLCTMNSRLEVVRSPVIKASILATVIIVGAVGLYWIAMPNSSSTSESLTAPQSTGLAVLSHSGSHLLGQSHHGRGIQAKAILANIVGRNALYVSREPNMDPYHSLTQGEDACITDVDAGVPTGTVCASLSKIEERGLVTVNMVRDHIRVEMLLPNGVYSATLTDRTGVTHTVPVINNVAEIEDNEPASVQYRLGDGMLVAEYIPRVFTENPR